MENENTLSSEQEITFSLTEVQAITSLYRREDIPKSKEDFLAFLSAKAFENKKLEKNLEAEKEFSKELVKITENIQQTKLNDELIQIIHQKLEEKKDLESEKTELAKKNEKLEEKIEQLSQIYKSKSQGYQKELEKIEESYEAKIAELSEQIDFLNQSMENTLKQQKEEFDCILEVIEKQNKEKLSNQENHFNKIIVENEREKKESTNKINTLLEEVEKQKKQITQYQNQLQQTKESQSTQLILPESFLIQSPQSPKSSTTLFSSQPRSNVESIALTIVLNVQNKTVINSMLDSIKNYEDFEAVRNIILEKYEATIKENPNLADIFLNEDFLNHYQNLQYADNSRKDFHYCYTNYKTTKEYEEIRNSLIKCNTFNNFLELIKDKINNIKIYNYIKERATNLTETITKREDIAEEERNNIIEAVETIFKDKLNTQTIQENQSNFSGILNVFLESFDKNPNHSISNP